LTTFFIVNIWIYSTKLIQILLRYLLKKYKLVYQFGSIFAGSKYHSGQLYSRTRAKLSTPNIDLAARTD